VKFRFVAAWLLLTLIAGCGDSARLQGAAPVAFFERGAFPQQLSDWRLFQVYAGELVPNERVIPYDLKSALFTDYAHKFRTVYVPEGEAPAATLAGGGFDLPVGSILSKTFYYPNSAGGLLKARDMVEDFSAAGLALNKVKLIETRLLVHTTSGWIGLPYVWNDAGSEATLEVTGAQFDLRFSDTGESFSYAVPDFNQCKGCHMENLTAATMAPVGFKAHHLDKAYGPLQATGNQLSRLVEHGYLASDEVTVEGVVDWRNTNQSLDDRARSYLDINCGHCHNEVGAADTSGMFLTRTTMEPIRLGLCKPPVAAGQGTGGRAMGIDPGAANNSILVYRMASDDLGAMMPELGRSLVHQEGVALIEEWVNKMPGEC
jgi:uncharacterized repeat protein (TIGR03806 family)